MHMWACPCACLMLMSHAHVSCSCLMLMSHASCLMHKIVLLFALCLLRTIVTLHVVFVLDVDFFMTLHVVLLLDMQVRNCMSCFFLDVDFAAHDRIVACRVFS